MNESKPFYKTRLRGRGQITLPPEIRKKLKVGEGDDVLFFVNEKGQIVIDQVRVIDPEQAWFWSEHWQKATKESMDDFENGNFVEFEDMDKAIKYLHEYADAKNKTE